MGGVQRQGSEDGSAVTRVRVAGGVLLVAHLALVAWITLRPLDVPWVSAANLRPFAGIRADLALDPETAARRMRAHMLRAAVACGSPVGLKAKAVMEAGELVSDAIVSALIGERLDDMGDAGAIFDGSFTLASPSISLTVSLSRSFATLVLSMADGCAASLIASSRGRGSERLPRQTLWAPR